VDTSIWGATVVLPDLAPVNFGRRFVLIKALAVQTVTVLCREPAVTCNGTTFPGAHGGRRNRLLLQQVRVLHVSDLLPIIFSRGQNEGIDPRVAPPDVHRIAQNVRWRKDGRPAKRFGLTALTTTGLDAGLGYASASRQVR